MAVSRAFAPAFLSSLPTTAVAVSRAFAFLSSIPSAARNLLFAWTTTDLAPSAPCSPKVPTPPPTPNFDRLARPYHLLERLTFAHTLQHCRTRLLPLVTNSREALVLGDGDGRFLAELLRRNPHLHATAVDASARMLHQLHRRSAPHTHRLRALIHSDALAWLRTTPPPELQPDLIATHFLLDCLDQQDCNRLATTLATRSAPGALWLLSDFRIPPGPLALPARLLVRALYLAFGLLTGLRVRRLPDHAAALTRAGWTCLHDRHSLFGLLTTELWGRPHLPDRPL